MIPVVMGEFTSSYFVDRRSVYGLLSFRSVKILLCKVPKDFREKWFIVFAIFHENLD